MDRPVRAGGRFVVTFVMRMVPTRPDEPKEGRIVSPSRARVAREVPFRVTAVTLAMVAVMAVAGCGASASQAPSVSSTAPSAATSAPADTAATTGTGEGGCHDATIVTSLGPDDSAIGLAICDSAAEVAYAGDISSITVTAADTKELAVGIKGQPCIAEP